MLVNRVDQCTDASGMVQYKAEVANILKKKYNHQVLSKGAY